jgi:diguanylate cyclase (GGDEF)-like protein/PAS domain S-box-containing protein
MIYGTPIRFDLPVQLASSFVSELFRRFSAADFLVIALVLAFLAGAWTGGRRRRRLFPDGDVPEARPGELEMLRAVVASLPDLIYVKDSQSRFLLANQGTVDVMGVRSKSELLGRTDFDFYPRELAEAFFADEQRIIQTGKTLVSQDEHIKEADGRIRWIMTTKVPLRDASGRTIGIIGIGRNITTLKESEAELTRTREELRFKASHDSLTSLLNREAILEMLAREISRDTKRKGCTSVLLADIDFFKSINDRHGHSVGDEVLREVSGRFLQSVRSHDLVGRYGGEEFLIVLRRCSEEDALQRAEELRRLICESPIMTSQGHLPVSISLGVFTTSNRGEIRPEDLFREVDSALYAAKAAGRNCCRIA